MEIKKLIDELYWFIRSESKDIADMVRTFLEDEASTVDFWHYPSKGELPTEGEETLIIFKHRGEKVFKVDKYTKGGWLFSPKPIAWMPLPPPPKEEA